ncbi:hypothetical protein ACFXO7_38595, partial [Nocardia tengchongensis]|uniref:hypothetical protein n=1 Tax=Nocardia tengchongensis TaxID=2055889 RepID=UPI0036CA5D87
MAVRFGPNPLVNKKISGWDIRRCEGYTPKEPDPATTAETSSSPHSRATFCRTTIATHKVVYSHVLGDQPSLAVVYVCRAHLAQALTQAEWEREHAREYEGFDLDEPQVYTVTIEADRRAFDGSGYRHTETLTTAVELGLFPHEAPRPEPARRREPVPRPRHNRPNSNCSDHTDALRATTPTPGNTQPRTARPPAPTTNRPTPGNAPR